MHNKLLDYFMREPDPGIAWLFYLEMHPLLPQLAKEVFKLPSF